jgi:hypothetical protein
MLRERLTPGEVKSPRWFGTFDTPGVWSRSELAMYVAGRGGKSWPDRDVHLSAPVAHAAGAP